MTDDDFLYARRQEPRPEFAAALQQQLQQVKPVRSMLLRRTRQFMKAAAAFMLMSIAILTISPEARAYVAKIVENGIEYLQFGEIQVEVRDGDEAIERGENRPLPPEAIMPVAEAQALAGFKVPTWLPNNWSPVEEATVSVLSYTTNALMRQKQETVMVALVYPEKPPEGEWAGMYLSIKAGDEMYAVVGEGHEAREVEINGQKGVIFTGNWDGGTFGGDSKHVEWKMDGITYALSSTVLSEEVLLQVARSIK
jgi:hypothetical protein